MSAQKPPRRQSVGLMERNLNVDENLTLPITNKERTKGHRRAVMSMGGEAWQLSSSTTWDGLSETQRQRRTAQPRKSILKMSALATEDPSNENTNDTQNFAETVDFGALYSQVNPNPRGVGPRISLPAQSSISSIQPRPSLGGRRRVSFAPSAHVRMFERPGEKKMRKSVGPVFAINTPTSPSKSTSRRSSTGSSRRLSAQGSQSSQSGREPASPRSPRSPRQQYFVGEGDGEGEESMELEPDSDMSDASIDSDELLEQITSASGGPSPVKPTADPDEDQRSDDGNFDDEIDMEQTEVVGGGIINWGNEAEYSDEEQSMDLESDADNNDGGDDEERTMEFTVALGGPMPTVPPSGAQRGRASIGYSNPASEYQWGAPVHPGDTFGLDQDDEMEMEETAVYGGVYGGTDESISSGDDTGTSGRDHDPDAHTATYTYRTSADDSGMDFTVAGGGINATSTGMYTLTSMTNIFAPVPQSASEKDETRARAGFLSPTEHNNFVFPVLSPIKVPSLAPVPLPAQPTVPKSETPRSSRSSRGGSSTPKRTPRKSVGASLGSSLSGSGSGSGTGVGAVAGPSTTPSFARPTVSSTKKGRESLGVGAQPQASSEHARTLPSLGKRNAFEPSPAAGVAKRLSFTPTSASSLASASDSASVSSSAATVSKPAAIPTTKPGSGSGPTTPASARKRGRQSLSDEEESEVDLDVAPPSAKKRILVRDNANPFAPPPQSVFAMSNPGMNVFAKDVSQSVSPEARGVVPTPGSRSSVPPASRPSAPSWNMEESTTGPTKNHDEDGRALPRDATPATPEKPKNAFDSGSTEPAIPDAFTSPDRPPARPLPQYSGTPRRSFGTPHKSMGTPVRFKSPGPVRVSTTLTPAVIPPPTPAPAIEDDEDVEEDGEEEEEEHEEEEYEHEQELEPDQEPATIPLSAFLELVGVQFMDDIASIPDRRRSVIGRGTLSRAASSSAPGLEDREREREYALHDYAEAHVDKVLLNMYAWAIRKIKQDITHSSAELSSTESACDAANPAVVREYLLATDDDRGLFEMTLKEFKANTALRARSAWYDWKQSVIDSTAPNVREVLEGMRDDAAKHAQTKRAAAEVLPDLRRRRDELEKELAAQRAEVEAVGACDAKELADLKEAVVEQDAEISRLKTEVDEKTSKNDEMASKLEALTSESAAHTLALETARSMCDEFTPSDIVRLEREWTSMQSLHAAKILHISRTRLEVVFARELSLSVRLDASSGSGDPGAGAGVVDPSNVTLHLVSPPNKSTAGLLELARAAVQSLLEAKPTLPRLVQAVGQVWTAARRFRAEVDMLNIYFPTEYVLTVGGDGLPNGTGANKTGPNGVNGHGAEAGAGPQLHCSAALMLPSAASRASISFVVTPRALLAWPAAVAGLNVRSEIMYGSADPSTLTSIARETLATAVPHVPGVLLQACADAAGRYSA